MQFQCTAELEKHLHGTCFVDQCIVWDLSHTFARQTSGKQHSQLIYLVQLAQACAGHLQSTIQIRRPFNHFGFSQDWSCQSFELLALQKSTNRLIPARILSYACWPVEMPPQPIMGSLPFVRRYISLKAASASCRRGSPLKPPVCKFTLLDGFQISERSFVTMVQVRKQDAMHSLGMNAGQSADAHGTQELCLCACPSALCLPTAASPHAHRDDQPQAAAEA